VASNIEVKARSNDFGKQKIIAEQLTDNPPLLLIQEDVFFRAAEGRLKLRILGAEKGELIAYSRPDHASIKQSTYEIYGTTHPERLLATLFSALPIEGTVRKRRYLYLWGQTRIHLDEVEGLGQFIELEVVLTKDQAPSEGHAIAKSLITKFEISEQDLIDVAYVDLLRSPRISPPPK
jgi:predicted adenylyl cyclase CyaB